MPLAASPKLCRTLVAASVCLGSMGLATTALAQGTPEQQKACTPDALRLCSAEIPDIPKTTACMRAHFGELSPACQAAFPAAAASAPAEKKRPRREAAQTPKPKPARPKERAAMVIRPDVTRPRPRPRLADVSATRSPEARVALAALPPARIAPAQIAPSLATPDPFGLADSRAQLARACRQGLIDAYTCRTTIPALYGRQ